MVHYGGSNFRSRDRRKFRTTEDLHIETGAAWFWLEIKNWSETEFLVS
jgi:hypothetical protein